MRSAEIAVPGGAKIPGVVAENVVFARPRWRKARTLSALRPGSSSRSSESKPERGAPAWPKAGRRAGRSRRSRPVPGDFPEQRFPRCRFRYEHHSVLIHRCGARARLRRVRVAVGFGVVRFFHGVHAPIRLGQQGLDLETILRQKAAPTLMPTRSRPAIFRPASIASRCSRLAFSLAASGLSPERRSRIHRRHAGDIIVAAVDFPQSRAEILQQVVAFEWP